MLFPADGEHHYEDFLRSRGIQYKRVHLPALRAPSRIRANIKFLLDLPLHVRRIVRILNTESVDLVHVNGMMNIAPVAAGLIARKSVVWHWNDTLIPVWFAALVKPLLRGHRCHLIVASQAVWDKYRLAKYADCYLGVVPPPVPFVENKTEANLPVAIGAQPVIGFVGHLVEAKGVMDFVKTIAHINNRGTQVAGIVVGGPLPGHEGYVRDLRKLIAELGIDNKLFFLGYRTDVIAVMHRFDVLLFPSHTEAAPIVVLQAMSLGLPIVATPVGNVPELAAILQFPLVPIGDVGAMATAVYKMLSMDDMSRRVYGASARNLVATRFSISAVATRHQDVYQKALSS